MAKDTRMSEYGKKSSEKLLKRLGSKEAVTQYFRDLRSKRKTVKKPQ